MGPKRNPKSQENDPQNTVFLQIQLQHISRDLRQAAGLRVLHRRLFNIGDARTHFSRLVERAAAGEEIIIAKAGRPRAKLVPIVPNGKRRKPGSLKGQFFISDDFDDPLPEEVLKSFE